MNALVLLQSIEVREVKYDTGVKDSLFNVATIQKGKI